MSRSKTKLNTTNRAKRLVAALHEMGFRATHAQAYRLLAIAAGDQNEHVLARKTKPSSPVGASGPIDSTPFALNPAQLAVFASYPDADLLAAEPADLTTRHAYEDFLAHSGNTVFSGLLIELATSEGCEDFEEAHRRVSRFADDLDVVLFSLEAQPSRSWA